MNRTSRLLITSVLGLVVSATAFAGPGQHRREDRREDRKQERREDRHERREDRRENRHDGPRAAPPAARFERHAARRGYLWVGGNYEWRGNAYVWIPGRYEAERRGYRWREPRWDVRDGVYVRVDGGWDSLGPTVAPPAVREERWENRHGFVYIRGRWNWQGNQWAWTPGHYERERAGHRWRDPRWEQRGGVYVSVDGGWE